MGNSLKIWFISDTHGQHQKLSVPKADVVIHCGDESDNGNPFLNEPESRTFFKWFTELDIPHKVFVPGNHSTAIEQRIVQPADYPEVTFLIHDFAIVAGLRVFGSPYTPKFYDWAYMKARSELDVVWQSITSDIDILITHGPPKGILDVTLDIESREPTHVGSRSLRLQVLDRIKPQIHAFGHIHDEKAIVNFGSVVREGVQFINCSCCDIGGRFKNNGMLIEIEPRIHEV